MAVLGSRWDGLSEHLIAHFYALDRDGNVDLSEPEVIAPFIEGAEMAMQYNWQSPFEHMGPESKAPAITALLQSGQLSAFSELVSDVASRFGFTEGGDNLSAYDRFVASAKGRTGITKINSTQIFNGMPPLRLTCTVLFRAWSDPEREVEAPIRKLMEWAAPKKLADLGVLSGLADSRARDERRGIEYLLPSEAPTRIAIRYANRTFSDMVIESISEPLTSPRARDGNYTTVALPMQIASLTALDRVDMQNLLRGHGAIPFRRET